MNYAVNNAGESEDAMTTTASTLPEADTEAPSKVEGIRVLRGSTEDEVRILWNPSTDESGDDVSAGIDDDADDAYIPLPVRQSHPADYISGILMKKRVDVLCLILILYYDSDYSHAAILIIHAIPP